MKKIFVRSPYIITINESGQTSAKIEVFIWNKGQTEPANPNYTVSKPIPSPTQIDLHFNVSNFAKEFIKPINANLVSVPTQANDLNWCFMRVKEYSNDTLINNEVYVCLNGYTVYLNGLNDYEDNDIVPLFNPDIKIQYNTQANVSVFAGGNLWLVPTDEDIEFIDGGALEVAGDFQSRVLADGGTFESMGCCVANIESLGGTSHLIAYKSEQVCEPKYTPLICAFVNRYGGWQFLTFFKASKENIQTVNKEYNLMPDQINYNPLQGQRKQFNQQGKKTLKVNTGFVNENYNEIIQDLMLSNKIVIDSKPVVIKSSQMDIKTSLNDKLINFEVEFEYSFGLINNVI